MNIALTEIQPVQSEPSDSRSAKASGNDGFNKLFDQQLDQERDMPAHADKPQVIENKDKISEIDGTLETSVMIPGESEAVLEFIKEFHDPLSLDAAEAVDTGPVNISPSTEYSAAVAMIGADPASVHITVNGEELPADGNILPLQAARIDSPAVVLKSDKHFEAVRFTAPVSIKGQDLDLSSSQGEKSQLLRTIGESAATDLPTPVKADLFTAKINVPHSSGPQIAGLDFVNIGDTANMSSRLVASTNTGLQQAALPPQLETLSLGSTRDSVALSGGLGERIQWMVNHNLNTARIRLDPPMLGRLDVHIQLVDDVTQVTINTQHAQTRDMIDSASLRLREFLQENGHQNVNVDVSQEQQQSFEQSNDDSAPDSDEGVEARDLAGSADQSGNRYYTSDSVVDYFA